MASSDSWSLIHTERRALAADLEQLSDEQWASQSLCAQWSVHEVLGHMVATAKMTQPRFIAGLASAGFRFNSFNAAGVAHETAGPPRETLGHFKAHLDSTNHPPGPITAMVGEAVLHSEDIRHPLGIRREYPLATLVTVVEFYKGSNLLLGTKNRIAGLTLRAADSDWSTGSGPEVAGPMISLLLAMTGRPAGLADLSGDGVATLRSRG
ncbi:MAG: maleylpyruvate isomerase family mycothiol-dependent enzyme [Candidatus Dormiibacterota bacterium]